MTYIASCAAPDLADLGASLRVRFYVGLMFHARQFPSGDAPNRLLWCYELAVDKMIREYMAGRSTLLDYIASDNAMSLFDESLGRFETCINSTKRALRLLDRLTAHPEVPAIDRTLKRLLHSQAANITALRDTIEHVDRDIVGESILATGMAHALVVTSDGEALEIGSHRLAFTELAAVVRHLHKAGVELLEALPSGAAT